MDKVQRTAIGVLALFLTISASGAQFESVIGAMEIEEDESSTGSGGRAGWESTKKIKKVRWEWPYYEAGAHDFFMSGSTKVGRSKNPNIGATTVEVYGSRTMISMVIIDVANESAEIKDLGEGKTTKIATTCDDDLMSMSIEFYRFVRKGYYPLFVRRQASYGAGGSGGEELAIAYDLEDLLLTSWDNPCQLVNR
ncbi:hypothetical protein HA520_06010 [Azotobacter chroococcum]|uniref:Uncharacterized protein n=1 Tax=Azotobacter chroococcum TaxID=353 RepID=A0AA43Z5M4_9GAMM|nr:hypothetical protein [Azotobacter chroococcum]NHN76842.1 hypothetical protein [Azotobacter chroococcum]